MMRTLETKRNVLAFQLQTKVDVETAYAYGSSFVVIQIVQAVADSCHIH